MRRIAGPLLFGLLSAFAAPANADVVSPKAEAVAVTIYRDRPVPTDVVDDVEQDDTSGLAMVVERRTVELPAGRTRVKFQGVADGIIPESAAVEGLPGSVVERNFDYDLLGPGSILQRYVGQSVRLVRTNPKTGKTTQETAIVRSGPNGVVLDIGGRIEALHCGGDPERLVFDHAPADLADRPTLSALVDVPAAGRYSVLVSYLTVRVDWSADYIARIAPDGRSLALSGWITLANRSSMSFANAPTAVVAGNLSRVEVQLPDVAAPTAAADCWPLGSWGRATVPYPPPPPPPMVALPAPAMMAAENVNEVIVTGAKRRVTESRLGDYHLYTLAEPTTLAARQTKQVMFLQQPAVRFEQVYVYQAHLDTQADDSPSDPRAASIVLRFQNKTDHGLGRGLPAGLMQIRLTGPAGRQLYAGSYPVPHDEPVGQPFEVEAGEASNVTVTQQIVAAHISGPPGHRRARVSLRLVAANAGDASANVEIRQPRWGAAGFRVTAESASHDLKAGDPNWRLPTPANGERSLTYTVEYDTGD